MHADWDKTKKRKKNWLWIESDPIWQVKGWVCS